jgi:hypothetical protein
MPRRNEPARDQAVFTHTTASPGLGSQRAGLERNRACQKKRAMARGAIARGGAVLTSLSDHWTGVFFRARA